MGMRLRAGDGVYTSRTMPDTTGENRSRFGQSFGGRRGGASVGRWDHSDAAAVLLEDAIGLHLNPALANSSGPSHGPQDGDPHANTCSAAGTVPGSVVAIPDCATFKSN